MKRVLMTGKHAFSIKSSTECETRNIQTLAQAAVMLAITSLET